ncbi:MAG: hypothetical protein QMD11_00625 [Smithella sp.]|nr:hypothetical protein [Smithella sp.]
MTLLAFTLSAYLFFSPCHFLKAAFAEGVTINFQNLLNILSVELPPNTTIPSISPTSPESSGALPSAFDNKNLSTNPNPINLLNIPDPTDELFRPLNFGPLIGDELLLPEAEYYTITVCPMYNEVAAPGCSETNTPEQAAEKLASFILNKSLKSVIDRPFRIILPSSTPDETQIRMLREIETRSVSIIESAMLEELKRSGKHLPETEEGSRQKETLTNNMNIARQSADNGTNWTLNLQKERSIHHFNVPKSYRQLSTLLVSGR